MEMGSKYIGVDPVDFFDIPALQYYPQHGGRFKNIVLMLPILTA